MWIVWRRPSFLTFVGCTTPCARPASALSSWWSRRSSRIVRIGRPPYRRNAARLLELGLTVPYAVAGTQDAVVREEVGPLVGEPVLVKNTASGFNSSNLGQVLRNWGVETLVFTGVATNFCVECTLRDASDLGFDCILIEDACAAVNASTHELGVESVRPFAQVVTTDEFIAILRQD